MNKHVWASIFIILVVTLLGVFIVKTEKPGSNFPFRFGLDLVGGTELVYRADTSGVSSSSDAMESLKEVIERRVNIFGVSEPMIQTESAGLVSGNKEERLIVGLPGVADLNRAIDLIGKTPILEFMLVKSDAGVTPTSTESSISDYSLLPTGLTGQYLSKSRVEFNPTTGLSYVALEFNEEGSNLFASITREHKGEVLAVVLDGVIISAPIIQDEIKDGKAQITGQFSPEQARALVRDLNYGALPVPITLATSQTVGATLGNEALNSTVMAGVVGFIALALFMILWYRLPGFISVLALISYIIFSLVVFKLVPVTLTAAGLAGFILSIGMAVDANVLIFERSKEELRKGKNINDALHEGFRRAWLSIRDSNISSIITASVLFWLGTAAIKGFALTLGIGVLVSMLSSITISRTFLFAITPTSDSKVKRFLFSNGLFTRKLSNN